MRSAVHLSYKLARRVVIGFFGLTVVLVGIALIVLPGPAFIVIPVGLGILGIEFAWARRWLKTLKQGAAEVIGSLKGSPDRGDAESS